MSSNTGLAGLAVTAVVSALVAFGVATLLGPAPSPAPPAAPSGAPDSVEGLKKEVDRLRREIQELRAARGPVGPAVPGVPGAPAPAHASSDPAPIPATREELRTFVDERLAERIAGGFVPNAATASPAQQKKRTLDEAGAELGLSSVDIDSVKRVWRESETEAVALLMGTPDMDAVREEVKAAQADPDKKAALITKVAGNVFRNLGKVATIKDRRNKELKRFLTDDQIKKLDGMSIQAFESDEGMDELFKGTFGD